MAPNNQPHRTLSICWGLDPDIMTGIFHNNTGLWLPLLYGVEEVHLWAGVEELVRLVDKEGILDTSLKARAFYDAFQVCCSASSASEAALCLVFKLS